MSRAERESYLLTPEHNAAGVTEHVRALTEAEALVFVFPTWFYGPPAILKGWLERVWLPGIAFDVPRFKGDRARGKLDTIKRYAVITTSGSPWWWLKLIRDPTRGLFARGLKVLFSRGCRMDWLQLHDMNNRTDDDRRAFLARVEARLGAWS
jgi:putative NADPH-quinone reductase